MAHVVSDEMNLVTAVPVISENSKSDVIVQDENNGDKKKKPDILKILYPLKERLVVLKSEYKQLRESYKSLREQYKTLRKDYGKLRNDAVQHDTAITELREHFDKRFEETMTYIDNRFGKMGNPVNDTHVLAQKTALTDNDESKGIHETIDSPQNSDD